MELLDRAIAAKGGLEMLRGIKTIVAKQTLTSDTPDGKSTTELTNYIGYPDRFRVETTTRRKRSRTPSSLIRNSPRRTPMAAQRV